MKLLLFRWGSHKAYISQRNVCMSSYPWWQAMKHKNKLIPSSVRWDAALLGMLLYDHRHEGESILIKVTLLYCPGIPCRGCWIYLNTQLGHLLQVLHLDNLIHSDQGHRLAQSNRIHIDQWWHLWMDYLIVTQWGMQRQIHRGCETWLQFLIICKQKLIHILVNTSYDLGENQIPLFSPLMLSIICKW